MSEQQSFQQLPAELVIFAVERLAEFVSTLDNKIGLDAARVSDPVMRNKMFANQVHFQSINGLLQALKAGMEAQTGDVKQPFGLEDWNSLKTGISAAASALSPPTGRSSWKDSITERHVHERIEMPRAGPSRVPREVVLGLMRAGEQTAQANPSVGFRWSTR